MLDTNVVLRLRDGEPIASGNIAALQGVVLMSIITRVELEGGAYADPAHAAIRRQRLNVLLSAIPTVAFGDADAIAYESIVAAAGYSRRKVIDRMIAAQALVHSATLITFNQRDFADVPKLSVLSW
jgi:tRNA(fMet)-specific endonuclease VapC